MQKKDAAIRKRQQIARSSRVMFYWVVGASMFVGISLVIGWFLTQQILFRIKIADAKYTTVSHLEKSNGVVDSLKTNIRALEANAALNSIKAKPDDNALQVILDALPADGNTLALGSSLQSNLIAGASGVSVESLTVDPVSTASTTGNTTSQLTFHLVVTSQDVNNLKNLLKRFERSIRVIDIDTMTLERTDTKYTLTMSAHAYYQPSTEIVLGSEVKKP